MNNIILMQAQAGGTGLIYLKWATGLCQPHWAAHPFKQYLQSPRPSLSITNLNEMGGGTLLGPCIFFFFSHQFGQIPLFFRFQGLHFVAQPKQTTNRTLRSILLAVQDA